MAAHAPLGSLNLRIFDRDGAMWKASVKDVEGDVLCVSQFTLFGNTTKGSKPDFHKAMVSV
jgi:D-tyrosyl-tRNA(Tyr) deacylase